MIEQPFMLVSYHTVSQYSNTLREAIVASLSTPIECFGSIGKFQNVVCLTICKVLPTDEHGFRNPKNSDLSKFGALHAESYLLKD